MVDGVKGVDRAVLIRTSMGASRGSVKKRQVLSQSLAVHPSILSAARARVGSDRPTRARRVLGASVSSDRRAQAMILLPLIRTWGCVNQRTPRVFGSVLCRERARRQETTLGDHSPDLREQ